MIRIYYDSGDIVEDGDPFWVPTTGVQVIWQEIPGVVSGLLFSTKPGEGDCYWWDGECWRTGDDAGFWQYLFKPGPQRIIFGTTISDARFQAIRDRAVMDRQKWRADGHS